MLDGGRCDRHSASNGCDDRESHVLLPYRWCALISSSLEKYFDLSRNDFIFCSDLDLIEFMFLTNDFTLLSCSYLIFTTPINTTYG